MQGICTLQQEGTTSYTSGSNTVTWKTDPQLSTYNCATLAIVSASRQTINMQHEKRGAIISVSKTCRLPLSSSSSYSDTYNNAPAKSSPRDSSSCAIQRCTYAMLYKYQTPAVTPTNDHTMACYALLLHPLRFCPILKTHLLPQLAV